MSRRCCPSGEDCTVCSGAPGGDEGGMDAWILDLGAGGWTNNSAWADRCPDIAGEFSLYGLGQNPSGPSYCWWSRFENAWELACTVGVPTPQTRWYDLTLQLNIVANPSGPGWVYSGGVSLILSPAFGSDICGARPVSIATYISASTESTNCLSLLDGLGRVQLDKISEGHSDGGGPDCCFPAPCSGVLADPIFAIPDVI